MAVSASAQFRIRGTVTDTLQRPVVFATVALYKDSVVAATAFTDTLGLYSLPAEKGVHQLSVSSTGYASVRYSLYVGADTTIPAVLQTDRNELEGTVVYGNRATLKRMSDRFVYSIGNTELVKGNTIIDVLKQTPLLNADENNVSVINRTSTSIYINGRRSNLTRDAVMNMLKNTSAEQLVRVEIITTPSSVYMVEGGAAIINLVLKKRETDGLNGSARMSDRQAFYNNQSAGGTLNYRKNKIGLSLDGWVNRMQQMSIYTSDFAFRDSSTQMVRSADRQPKVFYGGTLACDYNIDTRQTIGIRVDGSFNNQNGAVLDALSAYKVKTEKIDSLIRTVNYMGQAGSEVNVNGNYHIDIDSTGRFFNVDLDYLDYRQDQRNTTITTLADGTGGMLAERGNIRQTVPQHIRNYSGKLQYHHTLGPKTGLDIGGNGYFTRSSSDLDYAVYSGGDYRSSPAGSYDYRYDENVLALFAVCSHTWNARWQSTAGFRLEHTNNKGSITTGNHFENDYWNLLPYVSASFTPSGAHQFSYTFSNRIRRPSFWELNPFRYYITPTYYTENNPFLQPPKLFINELTYTLNSRYTVLLNYVHTERAYDQVQLNVPNTDTVKVIRGNYGTNDDASLSVSVQQPLIKNVLEANASVSGGYIQYNGRIDHLTIDRASLYCSADVNLTATISDAAKWYGYVNFNYTGPMDISYGHVQARNNLTLGIKKRYKEWTAQLWINDLLKGSTLRYTTEDNRLHTMNSTYYDTRSILVSLAYTFGNQKLRTNRERQTSNTEIKNRAQH